VDELGLVGVSVGSGVFVVVVVKARLKVGVLVAVEL
jgi:hypothetical protein